MRLKVLISAYACSPDRGSEPGLGWNAALQAARRHDVWVLCHPEGREAIERRLPLEPDRDHLKFIFLGSLKTRDRFFFPIRLLHWLYYYRWQFAALRVARRLHREIGFDLAHHLTLSSWRVPSLLHRLPIPLVFGPVGGGNSAPPELREFLGWRGRMAERLRGVSQVVSRLDPLVRGCLRKSARVLVATRQTRDLVSGISPRAPLLCCEVGVEPGDSSAPVAAISGAPLRIYWAGVLEPRKALPLLLHALARPGIPEFRLSVAGEGPEKERWQALTERLGLSDRVEFLGRLSNQATLSRYRSSDVFVFSSLRESTGTVLLEAMAAGLPVIALAWSGAPDVVPAEAGILVPPGRPEAVIDGFAKALIRLGADPELRRTMGKCASAAIEMNLSWRVYGDKLDAIYQEVSGVSRS